MINLLNSADQKTLEKLVMKTFSHHGLILRPSALTKCFDFLGTTSVMAGPLDLVNQDTKSISQAMSLLIQNVQEIFMHGAGDKNIVEDTIIDEAIKLYQKKLLNSTSQKSHIEEETPHILDDIDMEEEELVITSGGKRRRRIDDNTNNSNMTLDKQISNLINNKLKNSVVFLNKLDEIPNLIWDKSKQGFVEMKKSYEIFGSPMTKIEMYRERFQLIREKMLKSNDYVFPFQGRSNSNTSQKILISDVGSLLGSTGEKNILGIIFQSEQNTYFIQDFFHKAKLDINPNNTICDGFIVEGNIVIATGVYKNDVFHVKSLSHPIVNENELAKLLGDKDPFGFKTKVDSIFGKLLNIDLDNLAINDSQNSIQGRKAYDLFQQSLKNKQKSFGIFDLTLNPQYKNLDFDLFSILVISNFAFDKIDVLNSFEKILESCNKLQPLMFILLGEFCTHDNFHSGIQYEEYEQSIDSFLAILEKYPNLMENCFWVMVPSPNDFCTGTLPIKQMTSSIFAKFEKKIPLWINGTNPFRMSIFGKTFIISRQDITKDLKRNTLGKLDETIDINPAKGLVEAILSQSHLCPLNLYLQPILSDYDYTLRLIKEPDFLILADGIVKRFIEVKSDINSIVCNPGNFSREKTFLTIWPSTMTVSLSEI